MKLQQVQVKYFLTDDAAAALDQETLIPVFHRWIREGRLGDRLLIDVADYRHVPEGPGVMIIADGAHYGMDEREGRVGLAYARKRDELGDAEDKLAEALRAAVEAAALLEKEPSVGARFDPARVEVSVVSRFATRGDDDVAGALEAPLRAVLVRAYGDAEITLARVGDTRGPLRVEARVARAGGQPAGIAEILAHLT